MKQGDELAFNLAVLALTHLRPRAIRLLMMAATKIADNVMGMMMGWGCYSIRQPPFRRVSSWASWRSRGAVSVACGEASCSQQ